MRQRLAYLGCSFGTGAFAAFNNFTLTLWLAAFTDSYLLIGLLGSSRAFVGAVVSPLVGAWSDRVWLGWLGRRRPFILAGTALAGVGMALTPLAEPSAGSLGPTIAMILLFTAFYNAADDVHQALLVDITAPTDRNGLAARGVVLHFTGQVVILVIGFVLWKDAVPDWAFALTAAMMVGGALVTVLGVREPAPSGVAAVGGAPPKGITDRFRDIPRGAFIFGLAYFCYWSGVNAVMPLVSIYTRDILGASIGEAQLLPALLLLSTTLCALPMGWLGDRFGRRHVMLAGYAIVGLCGLAGLVITTKQEGTVVFLLAGVGNAASMVLTVPLLAELVPARRIGAATGLLAASGSLAAPLASLAAGALSDLFGPRAIFGLMGVMVALALVLLPLARPSPISMTDAADGTLQPGQRLEA
jgi:MFS family permease